MHSKLIIALAATLAPVTTLASTTYAVLPSPPMTAAFQQQVKTSLKAIYSNLTTDHIELLDSNGQRQCKVKAAVPFKLLRRHCKLKRWLASGSAAVNAAANQMNVQTILQQLAQIKGDHQQDQLILFGAALYSDPDFKLDFSLGFPSLGMVPDSVAASRDLKNQTPFLLNYYQAGLDGMQVHFLQPAETYKDNGDGTAFHKQRIKEFWQYYFNRYRMNLVTYAPLPRTQLDTRAEDVQIDPDYLKSKGQVYFTYIRKKTAAANSLAGQTVTLVENARYDNLQNDRQANSNKGIDFQWLLPETGRLDMISLREYDGDSDTLKNRVQVVGITATGKPITLGELIPSEDGKTKDHKVHVNSPEAFSSIVLHPIDSTGKYNNLNGMWKIVKLTARYD